MIDIESVSLKLFNEKDCSLNSTDNLRMYDSFYYGVNCDKNNVTTKIGIRCTVTGLNLLLMGARGVSGLHDSCYLIDEDNILICVSDNIFSINITDLSVNWVIQGDLVTCFQIKKWKIYI
ncbi:MAG: hypothetical protein FH761_11340 [Firmicutes bacterium]|nr:hypothetical protein [Bacillota bacterium]